MGIVQNLQYGLRSDAVKVWNFSSFDDASQFRDEGLKVRASDWVSWGVGQSRPGL